MKLSDPQKHKLKFYLQTNAPEIRSLGLEAGEVAINATSELGFRVSVGMVCHRMGPGKKIEHTWPNSDTVKKARASAGSARTAAVAKFLGTLAEELGIKMPEDFKEVLEWAREDVHAAVATA